jgi:hypothetical protein
MRAGAEDFLIVQEGKEKDLTQRAQRKNTEVTEKREEGNPRAQPGMAVPLKMIR